MEKIIKMKEQKIKTIIPKSESELESCVSGDLVKVKIIDSLPEFHVYLKINVLSNCC